MGYKVKEIYFTLQGEGAHTGRPAVFCRFSGCNLWSGREEDRHKAICKFCDTDFWGTDGTNGGKFDSAESLAKEIQRLWADRAGQAYVVCTGGEPMLQLDEALITALHGLNIEVGVETNGTIAAAEGIDWLCVSPKANTEILINKGNELKVVYPQKGIDPKDFETMNFEHFFLQPMDNEQQKENIQTCVDYCQENSKWKLSLQTHKLIGLR